MSADADRRFGDTIAVQVQSQKITAQYQVRNWTDYSDAYNAILVAAAADTPMGFLLQNIDLEEEASGVMWHGSAVYNTPEIQEKQPKQTGESSFNFNTGGGSQHVLQAVKHISSTKCPGASSNPPDFGGAINVDGEGNIGGCDIITPVFRFTATLHVPAEDMTSTYMEDLTKTTGKTNDSAISMTVEGVELDFEECELILEGVSGGTRGAGDWELAMNFAVSRNATDVCVDWPASSKPSGAVPKKGWEFAWIRYEEKVDANNVLVRLPAAVMIEQVYNKADFTKLNVPT